MTRTQLPTSHNRISSIILFPLPTPFPGMLLGLGIAQCLLNVFWGQSGGWRHIINPGAPATRGARTVLDVVGKFGSPWGEYRLDLARRSSDGLFHGPFTLLGDEEECCGRDCRLSDRQNILGLAWGRTSNDGDNNDNHNDGNEATSGQHRPAAISRCAALCA